MSVVDMKTLETRAREDFEFTRETRYLDGAVKIGMPDGDYVLQFANGKLQGIELGSVADADCKIVVRGTEDHWKNLLADKPKPFFQCLQSTAVKHGMFISDSNETFAYLPALNRMMVLMRLIANKG
ncbi:hypothetical protein NKI77_21720 [Mesorhizobium opportunistum]|uniref:SCP2 domain-containing protein n=1 Tax=Mesorhizobium opportunistum TaxID=593909 RepID=A0ABV1YEE7_9HYPH|nr:MULTISPECIES: hypothetical protein [Mesorhizobium]ESY64072.1 hypothetical protein X742_27175 [Mesorhizobium sp. LNHC232B00]WJI35781.1 hypothetical protein NL534_17790 [Mesorhizobium opportunistum]